MISKVFFISLLSLTNRLFSDQLCDEDCGLTHYPHRISVRYTTPRGIGYKGGYTSLEGFFPSKDFIRGHFLPFLDIRGHIFDDGRFAANGGLGFRYLSQKRVWGLNSYYDYRGVPKVHYQQIGLGFETLGRVWDFRVNGYFPFGNTKTPWFSSSKNVFQNHLLMTQVLRRFSMKGVNGEIGFHLDHFKKAPIYFTGGSYYLTGCGKTTWGGELRGSIELFSRHLRLEVNTSYDRFFKWTGQGQLTLSLAFGPRSKIEKRGGRSCNQGMILQRRAYQQVDRHEIIPEGNEQKKAIAINPDTGKPWFFWFVDNTSSSLGTFESPFSSLLDAQNNSSPNDVIYVFPGNGTDQGMNHGIVLKNGQLLLGSSVSHQIPTTIGMITLKTLSKKAPTITNIGGDVVVLANHNTVSGFSIPLTSGHGLKGSGISDLKATNNSFITSDSELNGIYLINPVDQVLILKSLFDGFSGGVSSDRGNGVHIEINEGNTLNSLLVESCHFTNMSNPGGNSGGKGIYLHLNRGDLLTFDLFNSKFSHILNRAAGLGIEFRGSSLLSSLNIATSQFSDIRNGSSGLYINLNDSSKLENMTVSQNSFSDMQGEDLPYLNSGTFLLVNNHSRCGKIRVIDTSFTNISGGYPQFSFGMLLLTKDLSVVDHFEVSGSFFNNITNESAGLSVRTFETSQVSNMNITGCSFNSINTGSYGVFADTFHSSSFSSMNILGSSFSDISNQGIGVGGFSYNSTLFSSMNVSNSYFRKIGNLSCAVYKSSSDNSIFSNVSVLSNTFEGDPSSILGYAVFISNHSGTTCADLKNNQATPMSTPDPYYFRQVSGVLNRTEGSDSTTNRGAITIFGTVGEPGSCFQ